MSTLYLNAITPVLNRLRQWMKPLNLWGGPVGADLIQYSGFNAKLAIFN